MGKAIAGLSAFVESVLLCQVPYRQRLVSHVSKWPELVDMSSKAKGIFHRDPFLPVMEAQTQAIWIMDAYWSRQPSGVLYSQDDGVLRFWELSSTHRSEAAQTKDRAQSTWT